MRKIKYIINFRQTITLSPLLDDETNSQSDTTSTVCRHGDGVVCQVTAEYLLGVGIGTGKRCVLNHLFNLGHYYETTEGSLSVWVA